jgi:hypothetical protein
VVTKPAGAAGAANPTVLASGTWMYRPSTVWTKAGISVNGCAARALTAYTAIPEISAPTAAAAIGLMCRLLAANQFQAACRFTTSVYLQFLQLLKANDLGNCPCRH